MTARSPEAPEFSRPVATETLAAGQRIEAVASEAERSALALRFDVPEVRALRVRAEVQPWGPGGWRLAGLAEAGLTQTCVVTLEPVRTEVSESFERFFAPPERMPLAEALIDPDLDEAPEPVGAAIDLGEIAAETVALAIDPYPRRAGVAFGGAVHGPPGVEPLDEAALRPFAGLAALKPPGSGR